MNNNDAQWLLISISIISLASSGKYSSMKDLKPESQHHISQRALKRSSKPELHKYQGGLEKYNRHDKGLLKLSVTLLGMCVYGNNNKNRNTQGNRNVFKNQKSKKQKTKTKPNQNIKKIRAITMKIMSSVQCHVVHHSPVYFPCLSSCCRCVPYSLAKSQAEGAIKVPRDPTVGRGDKDPPACCSVEAKPGVAGGNSPGT